MNRLGIFTVALLCSMMGACRTYVDWKVHVSLRSSSEDFKLSTIDPAEAVRGAVLRNQNYASIAIERVFFRDLPGIFNKHVAFGVEVMGVLPGGKAIKNVVEIKQGQGEHGILSFENPTMIRPFLYQGRAITISLAFRVVAPKAVAHISGQLESAGDLIRNIDPAKSSSVKMGESIWSKVLESVGQTFTWRYTMTLQPAEGSFRDQPQLLFTGSRHILLLLPPPNAPKRFKQYTPVELVRRLKLHGSQLVWKKSGKAYFQTPYMILNIVRYKRYPKENTEIKKFTRQVDNFVANGNYKHAQSSLQSLGVAINEDQVITTREKNLERAWLDYRSALVAEKLALQQGDKAAQYNQILLQLDQLILISQQFDDILYKAERSDMAYKRSKLLLRARNLAQEMGKPGKKLRNYSLLVKKVGKSAAAQATAAVAVKKPLSMGQIAELIKKHQVTTREPPTSYAPFYHKWWFWTLVSAAAATTGLVIYFGARSPGMLEAQPVNPH